MPLFRGKGLSVSPRKDRLARLDLLGQFLTELVVVGLGDPDRGQQGLISLLAFARQMEPEVLLAAQSIRHLHHGR